MNETASQAQSTEARSIGNGTHREPISEDVRQGMFAALDVACTFEHTGVSVLVLMGVGCGGLIEALESHVPDRDGPFLDHAPPLIERRIHRWLRACGLAAEPTTPRAATAPIAAAIQFQGRPNDDRSPSSPQ